MGLTREPAAGIPNGSSKTEDLALVADLAPAQTNSLGRFTYPRASRMTKPAEFAAALGVRPSVRNLRFTVHLKRSESTPAWRLGLVIPKRWLTRAVDRNIVRRAWREAFRGAREDLEKLAQGHDMLVRLVAKPQTASLAALKAICRDDAAKLILEIKGRMNSESKAGTRTERPEESNAPPKP